MYAGIWGPHKKCIYPVESVVIKSIKNIFKILLCTKIATYAYSNIFQMLCLSVNFQCTIKVQPKIYVQINYFKQIGVTDNRQVYPRVIIEKKKNASLNATIFQQLPCYFILVTPEAKLWAPISRMRE